MSKPVKRGNPFAKRVRAKRAIVLIVEEDGTQRGWEVFDADVNYEITGYPHGSAHGRISAHGEFHQMTKTGAALLGLEAGFNE